MKLFFLGLLIFLSCPPTRAQWISPQTYFETFSGSYQAHFFPVQNGFLSTVYGAFYQPLRKFQTLQFQFRSGRQSQKIQGRRISAKAQISYLLQNHKAPLMVVIPGLGGSAVGPMSQSFSEIFYNLGYHVVIVPNTMSADFSLQISRDGAVGYMPRDAQDLYEFLHAVDQQLQSLISPKKLISDYFLVGFSLGGQIAILLDEIDSQQPPGLAFHFNKVGAFNPPLEIHASIKKLDEFAEPAQGILEVERELLPPQTIQYHKDQDISRLLEDNAKARMTIAVEELQNQLLKKTVPSLPIDSSESFHEKQKQQLHQSYYEVTKQLRRLFFFIRPDEIQAIQQLKSSTSQDSQNLLKDLYQKIRVRNETRYEDLARWAIGIQFRKSLTEIILMVPRIPSAPQEIRHLPPMKFSLGGLGNLTFSNYEKTVILPLVHREEGLSFTEIYAKSSLMNDKSNIQKNRRLYFFHNADDFLFQIHGADAFVQKTFQHAVIFPFGGHCGNFWFYPNLKSISEAFALQPNHDFGL